MTMRMVTPTWRRYSSRPGTHSVRPYQAHTPHPAHDLAHTHSHERGLAIAVRVSDLDAFRPRAILLPEEYGESSSIVYSPRHEDDADTTDDECHECHECQLPPGGGFAGGIRPALQGSPAVATMPGCYMAALEC